MSDLIKTGLKPKTGMTAKVGNIANISNALATATVAALAGVGTNIWAAMSNPFETFMIWILPINYYLFQALQSLVVAAVLAGLYYFVVKPASLGIKETESQLMWTNFGKTVTRTVDALDKSESEESVEVDNSITPKYTGSDTSDYYVDDEKNSATYQDRQAELEALKEKRSLLESDD